MFVKEVLPWLCWPRSAADANTKEQQSNCGISNCSPTCYVWIKTKRDSWHSRHVNTHSHRFISSTMQTMQTQRTIWVSSIYWMSESWLDFGLFLVTQHRDVWPKMMISSKYTFQTQPTFPKYLTQQIIKFNLCHKFTLFKSVVRFKWTWLRHINA